MECADQIFAGNTDVIIVGAGVAGSALAYALAKDGWRVHVIERDLTEPDRIVGEFLHAGGCIKLAELGLEDCLDGSDSQTVFSFAAVHKDGKRSAISYPSNASGRGFHYGRFVQKLREKAASLPKCLSSKRPILLWIRIRDVTNQRSCEHA
ncbi:hypothetical protein DKX38_028932 [Salix brachista]|uniref:Squalene monooxygenase n=1 Tax=Salix brachista TaxID=2182728 RepID=A0A5N5J2E0_9ROSI|nr:hypothetical protein DKX38_028932 [Salix brachista]